MVWEFINVFFIAWIYFYLIKLYKIGCECAMSPSYYFLAFYMSLSIVMLAIGASLYTYPDILPVYLGFAFVYFILTLVFIFVTFGYVRELEEKQCKCAGDFGPDIIYIFAWLRILSFILAILSIVYLLSTRNKSLLVSSLSPAKRNAK